MAIKRKHAMAIIAFMPEFLALQWILHKARERIILWPAG